MAVNHELRDLALINPQNEPQAGLLAGHFDDLYCRGQVHGSDREIVRVVYVRIIAEQDALGPLRDDADARVVHDAYRVSRLLRPEESPSRDPAFK